MRAALGLVLLVAASALAGSIEDLDAKNGFRGIRLGCTVAELGEVTSLGQKDGLDLYSSPPGQFSVGHISLKPIIYAVYKDQLMSIEVVPARLEDKDALIQVMTEAYGPPTFSGTWIGKVVELYDEPTGGFRFSSQAIKKQWQADQEEAKKETAKKAASDL